MDLKISQNHNMVYGGRVFCSSRNIQSKMPRTISKGLLKIFNVVTLANLCQRSVIHSIRNRKMLFLMLIWNLVFQFVPFVSCLDTGHRWKKPGSILFALSLQEFIHVGEIPQLPKSLMHNVKNLGTFKVTWFKVTSDRHGTYQIKERPRLKVKYHVMTVYLTQQSRMNSWLDLLL